MRLVCTLARVLRVGTLCFLVTLVLGGCTERRVETHQYGNITVQDNWEDKKWSPAENHSGIASWTIRANGRESTVRRAKISVNGGFLLVGVTEADGIEGYVYVLDMDTGLAAKCERCDCELVERALGWAFVGELGRFDSVSSSQPSALVVHLKPQMDPLIPDYSAKSMCALTFAHDGLSAGGYVWPGDFSHSKLITQPSDHRVYALGCRLEQSKQNSCAMIRFDSGSAAKIIEKVDSVNDEKLTMEQFGSVPHLVLRGCENEDPCWTENGVMTSKSQPFPIGIHKPGGANLKR